MPVAAQQTEQKRNAGRPRCQAAHNAILNATARLLRSTSVRELAIETIAREAGVGKATIYRWWPNKAAIVIDAFFSEVVPQTKFPTTGSAQDAVRIQCKRLIDVLNGPFGSVVGQIIGEGQSNADVLEKFRDVFLNQRRREFAEIYRRGVRDGEFEAGIDAELAADLVYGPVWYRLLAQHQPLDEAFARQLPDLALATLAPKAQHPIRRAG